MKRLLCLFIPVLVLSASNLRAQNVSEKDSSTYEYFPESKTDADSEETRQAQAEMARRKPKSEFSEKIFFGGGFGAGFGDYTFINISPIVGYRFNDRLSGGMRLMYQYTTFEYFIGGFSKERYNSSDLGIGPFARLLVYGPVYLQAEYEYLSFKQIYPDGSSSRTNFDSFMAGGGVVQTIGRNASLFATVLYNFSYDGFNDSNVLRSPYNSPWVVRMGIAGGF
jgi:hypothetical protein